MECRLASGHTRSKWPGIGILDNMEATQHHYRCTTMSSLAFKFKVIFFTLLSSYLVTSVNSFPEQGKWTFNINDVECSFIQQSKALLAGSKIKIRITCDPTGPTAQKMDVSIGWLVRETSCFEEYLSPELSTVDFLKWYYTCPATNYGAFGYSNVRYLKSQEQQFECSHLIHLTSIEDQFRLEPIQENSSCAPNEDWTCGIATSTYDQLDANSAVAQNQILANVNEGLVRRKRGPPIQNQKNDALIEIPEDGIYMLILVIQSKAKNIFNAQIEVEMKSDHGYLSAVEWPLLHFYGLMCLVYLGLAIGWLVVSATQFRDLLRIQFWIGGVILLGMIEKAVFYAEYQSINSTGQSVKGAVLAAEIISTMKRALARILVIIVSLGFGIVKPRLGPMLHRVVCLGMVYFIAGSAEATLRVYRPKHDPSNQTMMASVPLAVLDSIICWWVFTSLMQTTRTLRLRRNLVKLNLYRNFTNTLVFAVFASVLFMMWAIHSHRLTVCLTEWKNLWWDEAFWHLLFSIVLLVIMVLWRPTNNNQRYAFTPLLDASDDEQEDIIMDAMHLNDGDLKMRTRTTSGSAGGPNGNVLTGTSGDHTSSGSTDQLISREAENDLKWIQENIPSSLTDSTNVFIDSDEEILTARFERNKME